MTETIRYTKLFLEDLAVGTGTQEVTLADGRVVTLSEINLNNVLSFSLAGLPSVGNAGRLARVTDTVRGLWMDTGVVWAALNGKTVDLQHFITGGAGTDASPYTGDFQTALTAAANGSLYVPRAVFGLSTALTYNTTVSGPLRIFGDGPSSIFRLTGATNKGIVITGSAGTTRDFVYCDNFQIKSNTSGSSVALLHLDGVAAYGLHALILNGNLKSAISLLMEGTQQGEVSDCSILSSTVGAQFGKDVALGSSNAVDGHGNTFAGNTTDLKIIKADDGYWYANHFVETGVGTIAVDQTTVGGNGKMVFRDNHIEGHETMFKVSIGKVHIVHNEMYGAAGVTAISLTGGTYSLVEGNQIVTSHVSITGGTNHWYINNFVTDANETVSATSVIAYGNQHFGTGTVYSPRALFNGPLVTPFATLTYGVNVAVDASRGNTFIVTVTNGTAFTIDNATNVLAGQKLTIMVRNGSGGAMGVITWGTAYKLAGAFTNPANATRRLITFFADSDGGNWYEMNRSAADVPD